MTLNDTQVAAAVYQACTTYDQFLPQLSKDVARSWAKVFAYYRLTPDELIAGVDKVYLDHGSGYRPLPADIANAARQLRRDRSERESDAERRAREDRIDQRVAQGVAMVAAACSIPEHPARSEEHTAWPTCQACNRNLLTSPTAVTTGICPPCERVSAGRSTQHRQEHRNSEKGTA
jgi:hypothetical protein